MMIRRQQHGTRCVAGLVLTAGAIALVAALFAPARVARAADDAKEPAAEQVEMFEKKIRPVLVEKCYSCHSHQAKKLKGEYYTDSRDAIRKGGESGKPAIVPGDPDKSPLIAMIRRTDPDEAMPPKEKDALTKEQIKDFEDWVKAGAPDPRKEANKSAPGKPSASAQNLKNPANAQQHWAFRKPVESSAPSVKNARWVRSPIDAFVIAKLESKDLTPAPQADKHTLIRRAYFDLIGLPPTAEEVAAFEADQSADAFAKVVDHLLASPRYGERWGRYWLDVARYADTKGYVFEQERKFPYSYTYRDYVIRAFNEDLPYDQFLIQQLAADKLDLGADKRPLAAMGFLTLGRRFLENQADIIDDRIDVVTRGTMGLTVQCARCHDHKYDPIPTADYYSLYGIFASSVEPKDLPTIGSSEQNSASLAFDKELKTRAAAVESFLADKTTAALKGLRTAKVVADCLIAAQTPDAVPETLELNKKVVARWAEFLAPSKAGHDPIFTPWHAYAAIPAAEFAAKAPAVTEQLFAKRDEAKPIHPLVAEMFRDKPPTSLRDVADRYGKLLADNSAEQAHADADKEALRMVLHGLYSPLHATGDQRFRFLRRDDRTAYNNLKKKVDELKANDPGAPPAAMVLNDSPTPNDTPIFKRGNPGLPGEVVPRRFLAALSTGERKPFRDGSGRLELAKAIASKDNPLTARVMVNRVWMEHFGAGLVRTPSDFGVRSDPPANPELLDYLAVRFMNDGWSLKKLHRQIMLSATWQQASDHPQAAQYANVDAENTLLWKQNRRRMDFEAMRDTLLKVAGTLDDAMGGRAVDITDAANNRRTVYGFIDRQNLPGVFRTFDFASPDTHSPGRFFTTVPQQALFMMNSPFIERASRQVVARKDVAPADAEAGARIARLYQTLFGRSPSAEETSDAVAFVSGEQVQAVVGATPWRYGYGRYDASSDRVVEFTPLGAFNAGQLGIPPEQVSANPQLKWATLTATGGHPGTGAASAVIRRWVAPADGVAVVSGTVSHQLQNSDGVLARVVASGTGQVTSVAVQRMDVTTNITGVNVKKGDTIDFVVESRATTDFDSFTWSPNVKLTPPNATVAGGVGVVESDAQRDFAGASSTAMSPWEKYAQVLLLSNEFAFVD
jgi:hypothetical protein